MLLSSACVYVPQDTILHCGIAMATMSQSHLNQVKQRVELVRKVKALAAWWPTLQWRAVNLNN